MNDPKYVIKLDVTAFIHVGGGAGHMHESAVPSYVNKLASSKLLACQAVNKLNTRLNAANNTNVNRSVECFHCPLLAGR